MKYYNINVSNIEQQKQFTKTTCKYLAVRPQESKHQQFMTGEVNVMK